MRKMSCISPRTILCWIIICNPSKYHNDFQIPTFTKYQKQFLWVQREFYIEPHPSASMTIFWLRFVVLLDAMRCLSPAAIWSFALLSTTGEGSFVVILFFDRFFLSIFVCLFVCLFVCCLLFDACLFASLVQYNMTFQAHWSWIWPWRLSGLHTRSPLQ